MSEPPPADVTAAASALALLGAVEDTDPRWARIATPTRWTAAHTLEHIADALLFYSGQVARRAQHRLPLLRDGRTAPPSEQVDIARTAAHVLEGLLRDMGSARAWHPSGLADVGGWVGMAVTEILVHGHDAATAMDIELPLPRPTCARTLARVFPWVPNTGADPGLLLLAVTGRASISGLAADPEWWWQSAPISEWDGQPRRRTRPPGWS